MSVAYFAIHHSSMKTPFWESLHTTPNLKASIADTFPDDDVPEPALPTTADSQSGDELNRIKLLAVKNLIAQTVVERDQKLAPADPLRFRAMHTLGMVDSELGQYPEAETAYKRLITESDKNFGPESRHAHGGICNLGKVYENQGKYSEAEATLRRSMKMLEPKHGKESPQYLGHIRSLVSVLAKQGKFSEADSLLEEGLALVDKMSGDFKEEETQEMKEVAEQYKKLKQSS